MRGMIINWLVSGLSLIVVSTLVQGIEIDGFGTALVVAIVYGLISVTLGLLLKLIALPLIILTLGIFWFVINALMLQLASAFVPGFRVRGFGAAFVGAIALTIVQWLLHLLLAH